MIEMTYHFEPDFCTGVPQQNSENRQIQNLNVWEFLVRDVALPLTSETKGCDGIEGDPSQALGSIPTCLYASEEDEAAFL
jgi:hypothetical protein